MTGPPVPNLSTQVARAVLGELVHQGVRELVLAPGSRSAPLAFEALRLERAGRLRLHVRVDERSAGFVALGLAKVSGEPVAVVCTSGTAVANLTPAVVEASYAAVPLIIVTADRPAEVRGVGAPQTIDQIDFFGGSVRFFADVGTPRRIDPADPQGHQLAARALSARAVAAALGAGRAGDPGTPGYVRGTGALALAGSPVGHVGPAHLNVGFRLPLVPGPGDLPSPSVTGPAHGTSVAGRLPTTLPDQPHTPPRSRRPPLPGCDPRDLAELIGPVPARGVLLVGDLPPAPLRGHHLWLTELATTCGWPVVAEPSANLQAAATALGHAPLVLGVERFLADHQPDLVLSAGLFGLSRPTLELVRRARRHVALELAGVGREVCDPVRTATQVLTSIPLPPADLQVDPGWLAAWQSADLRAAAVVRELVGADPAAPLTGPAVARHAWAGTPREGLLLAAASWSVRHVEAFAGRGPGPRVISNRGVNGIDGLVSTAWGAALADQASGAGGAVALLGDLAFLHDHNGLLAGPDEPAPDLVVVVVDNDGGGIFHQLEQGRPEHAASFERLFGTPLGRDLRAVAEAAGAPARRVRTGGELTEALAEELEAGGVRVVVAQTAPRSTEARLLDEVRARVAASLAAGG